MNIRRLFCTHWWKHMRTFRSAYFSYRDKRDYVKYEVYECKLCGKVKTFKLKESEA